MSDSEDEQPSSVYQDVLQFVVDAQQNEVERNDKEIQFIKKNHKELQEEFKLIIEMIHDLGVHVSNQPDEDDLSEYGEADSQDGDQSNSEDYDDFAQAVVPYTPDGATRYEEFVTKVQNRFLTDNEDVTELFSSKPTAQTGLNIIQFTYRFALILISTMPLTDKAKQDFVFMIKSALQYASEQNPGLFSRLGQARQSGKRAAASI
jgi:hypothetical protein